MSKLDLATNSESFGTRQFIICLALLGCYFAGLLLPAWWPGFAGNRYFFFYLLSIPFCLLALTLLGVWGIIGAALASFRGLPTSGKHLRLIALPLAGVLICGSAWWLARLVHGELPTGSHQLQFDSTMWRDPASSGFVVGDITERQKMLGSLVERLTPDLNRADLEGLLGPSLETPYFQSTGRDLIYVLGAERDSFISIDSEQLLIWLDERGHFKRYEIATD